MELKLPESLPYSALKKAYLPRQKEHCGIISGRGHLDGHCAKLGHLHLLCLVSVASGSCEAAVDGVDELHLALDLCAAGRTGGR